MLHFVTLTFETVSRVERVEASMRELFNRACSQYNDSE